MNEQEIENTVRREMKKIFGMMSITEQGWAREKHSNGSGNTVWEEMIQEKIKRF
jgi:hypothetical protein